MLALALLSSFPLVVASSARADTSQFRGVNWGDSRDNFQAGVLYVSGLSSSDTYDSAFATGSSIMDQFMSKLGANAVRMPINEATVSTFWGTYTGAIDAVLAKGTLVFCYWDSAKTNKPADMNAFWAMWSTVVTKYGDNPRAYFEIFNEPNMYTKDDLVSLYGSWLSRFSTVPRSRVVLDGTGNAQNVSDVGSASSLDGCLLAVHDYSFFGSDTWTSESQWVNQFKGEVGSYSDRTVCTEWGGPMSPGSKNGVSYGALDYSTSPTNYFEAYVRGVSSQLRTWKMGSFYWPGLRDGDWYSMTTRSGTGANLVLSVPNQSGLAQLQNAWTGAPPGGAGGMGGTGGGEPVAGAGGLGGSGAAGRSGGDGGTGGRSDASGGRAGAGVVSGGVGGNEMGSASGRSGAGAGAVAGATGEGGGGVNGGMSATGGGVGGTSNGIGGMSVGAGGAGNAGAGGTSLNGGGRTDDASSGAPATPIPNASSGCSCSVEQATLGHGPGRIGLLLGFVGLTAAVGMRRRARRAAR